MRRKLGLPEENLLYFLEKQAPRLKPWQRELLRIARHISQYFYPQKQTKMMNEGCATFVHYEIVHRLHEKGLISDGALLEIMHSHTSVIFQPEFDDPRYNGINPYALGFAMMRDIKRICTEPTDEDRDWFPEIRRQRRSLRHAAPRLGELSRRKLRAAVSQPASSCAISACSRCSTTPMPTPCWSTRSTTNAAIAKSAARSRATTTSRATSPTSRSAMSISPATAASSCRMPSITASNLTRPARAPCSSTSPTLWGYGIRLEERDATTERVLKTHEGAARH